MPNLLILLKLVIFTDFTKPLTFETKFKLFLQMVDFIAFLH